MNVGLNKKEKKIYILFDNDYEKRFFQSMLKEVVLHIFNQHLENKTADMSKEMKKYVSKIIDLIKNDSLFKEDKNGVFEGDCDTILIAMDNTYFHLEKFVEDAKRKVVLVSEEDIATFIVMKDIALSISTEIKETCDPFNEKDRKLS